MIQLRNKKVAVLGLLDPGIATIRFAHKQGAKVKAFGVASEAELARVKSELKGIAFELAAPKIPKGGLLDADLIVQTPGSARPYKEEIEEARQKGIPILTDLELACQFYSAPIIAVTGTNGKSSVVKLIEKVLTLGGKKVLVAGGDFTDFADSLLKPGPFDHIVLELNSSRLKRVQNFHPHIAVLLNIYPGHSERHENLEEYASIKAKIFFQQTEKDFLVYESSRFLKRLIQEKHCRAKTYPFSVVKQLPLGASYSGLKDRQILFVSEQQDFSYFSADFPSLTGIPHVLNILAAVNVAKLCAVPDEVVQKMIADFQPIPDRLEFVRNLEGVGYYNDAKSVNLTSTAVALDSFADGSVILIAGGQYKSKQYYQKLRPQLSQKVRCLVIFGGYRKKFHEKWGEATETYIVPTLVDAVKVAAKKAEKGNKVLLSPACPPETHMHPSPHHRGEEFKRLVQEVAEMSRVRQMIPRRI